MKYFVFVGPALHPLTEKPNTFSDIRQFVRAYIEMAERSQDGPALLAAEWDLVESHKVVSPSGSSYTILKQRES